MKVTVQNGASHGLSRRDVEAMLLLLPASWSSGVRQIVLYQGDTCQLKSVFYPKEKLLRVFWPMPAESASKADGVRELLIALSVVTERGALPERLSPSLRQRHLDELVNVLRRCLAQVVSDAA